MNPVRPPRAANARAKLVPFPPGRWKNRSTWDCRSPRPGGTGGVTMSRIASPIASASSRTAGTRPHSSRTTQDLPATPPPTPAPPPPGASPPGRQSCIPRAAHRPGKRSSHGHRARGSGPPSRSIGTSRRARTSQEVLQGEVLVRLPEVDLLRLLLFEVLVEQVRLDRAHEEGPLVPAVHFRNVREGLGESAGGGI